MGMEEGYMSSGEDGCRGVTCFFEVEADYELLDLGHKPCLWSLVLPLLWSDSMLCFFSVGDDAKLACFDSDRVD